MENQSTETFTPRFLIGPATVNSYVPLAIANDEKQALYLAELASSYNDSRIYVIGKSYDSKAEFQNRNNVTDRERVTELLAELRLIRDKHPHGSDMRSCYNVACDRLDVLESKLIHES